LHAKAEALTVAMAACQDGSRQDTEHKNLLRADLIHALDVLADYVDLIAQGDREKLLASGFDVVTPARKTLLPLGPTAILDVTNVASTKLFLTLLVASGAWAYEVQVSIEPGVWVHNNTFTDPHDVVLENLVPGVLYAIRARVLGSRNRRGEWCEPVSHRAT